MTLYAAHLATMLSVYVILAASLNLMAGYGGMLSASHVALFGIGSYTLAYLATALGWPFIPALLLSIALASSVAFLIGSLCIRLAGDFFLLATLSVHLVFHALFSNWIAFTGGPYGIAGIPPPALFGWSAAGGVGKAAIAATVAVVSLLVFMVLLRSPFARCLQAVRDDAPAAAAMAKNSLRIRRQAFTIASAFAGLTNALYASTVAYVDPHAFALDELVFLIAIVVVGGAGAARGPIVGAVVLFLTPEALRLLPITAAAAANVRQILFGVLLVLAMRFRPQGLAGRYAFD